MRKFGISIRILIAMMCTFGANTIGVLAAYGLAEAPPSEKDHYFFGEPKTIDDRHKFKPDGADVEVNGLTKLVRPGFVVTHYDRYKEPAWVCMRWTRANLAESKRAPDYKRNYSSDPDLPAYARAATDYEFSKTQMTKGHVARAEDNTAFGKLNFSLGNRMSNLCPQHVDLNGLEWLQLEEKHHKVVASGAIDKVWIIAGPIFDDNPPVISKNNKVAIPKSFFKIVAWNDTTQKPHATGYIFPNVIEKGNLDNYKTPISKIEELTGFEFFPELEPTESGSLKSIANAGLWRHSARQPLKKI